MKRKPSIGVKIFAILFIVFGALGLLINKTQQPFLPSSVVLIEKGSSLGFLVAGIGLILLKNWARILTIGLMVFSIVQNVIMEFVSPKLIFTSTTTYTTGQSSSVMIAGGKILWALIIFGSIIWFFSRKSMVNQFTTQRETED